MNAFRKLMERADLPWSEPEPLSGGDMGDVWRIGAYVAKSHPAPPNQLFPAEARGLVMLAEHGVRVPPVHFADETGIVMDWCPPGAHDPHGLANTLAQLHGCASEAYGSSGDVFLGRFHVSGSCNHTHWQTLWRTQRITPLLRATWDTLGSLGPRIESLLDTYEAPVEGPSLLHGDLWNGNVVMARQGATLIDPSVWWGERGVDLAMMRLFGGFSPAFWSAYESQFPIPPEVRDAIPFYQLYYLLVHVHFFGSGYCNGVRQVLETYGV